jgi:hypothetical protein
VQQQTGVPPIIRQQVQPAFMQAIMQSQQPWIMSQQALSPLVQVTQQPSAVISHLHRPIVKLHTHTTDPFIMQQTLHMPPAIMLHRFCIIVQAVGSSQVQVIFIPPAHFSIFIVQRGTIIMFGAMPGAVPMPVIPVIPVPMPIPVIAARSIIMAVVMIRPPVGVQPNPVGNIRHSRPEHPAREVRPAPEKAPKYHPSGCFLPRRG